MTKLLALFLVLSALFTVGHCYESEGDVIMKDGHRVVVVEYDRDGKTNTRVLISPPRKKENKRKHEEGDVFGNANRETASSLPVEDEREHHAFGKCKHNMASVLRKVEDRTAGDNLPDETPKEAVARAARDVEEKVSEKAREAKETMNESVTKKASNAQKLWERAKIVVWEVGTAVAVVMRLTKVGSVVGLIGIAAAYGMCVWVTFVSNYVLASVLGRQQFGVVQSKAIFERIRAEKEDGRGLDTSKSQSNEAAARSSGEKGKEKMDEDAVKLRLTKLSERLCKLNAYSSRLNLLTLMSLTWHLAYLGHRLSLTC